MKIGVFVKRVPDTEFKVKLKDGGAAIDQAEAKFVVNPYDEFAVEEALKLKEKIGGEVVVFCFGPKGAEENIRAALAMGADRGVRIEEEGFEGSDSFGVASTLAAAARKEGIEMLFAGKMAIDDQASSVGPMAAELLGWPQGTSAEKFEISGDQKTVTIHRPVGGGTVEVLELDVPALITADKGLNSPRYASLPNIMKAKKKPIDTLKAGDLGVDTSRLGKAGARVQSVSHSLPPARSAGRKIDGADLSDVAARLVRALREEAKVI